MFGVRVRGIWYTLEAVMAAIVMLGFLAAINVAYFSNPHSADIGVKAYALLEGMDNRGLLVNYTEALNYTGIAAEAKVYGYNVSAQVCDYAGNCIGSSPDANDVWAGSYVTAGLSSYQPREVRLYIWPK